MTQAYWCVLVAALLPFVFTGLAKLGGRRYNNHSPRDFLEKQEGYRKRAHWTQLNSFEAFPAFAAAVIIAHLAGGNQASIDLYAMAFIGFRIVYGVLYLANLATLRSLAWMGGLVCVILLFTTAA